MSNKNTAHAETSKAHAARVRLFQILCALDGSAKELSQTEIELRFEELFVIPEAPDGAGVPAPVEAPEEEENAKTDFAAFRASCAAACGVRAHLSEIDALISASATGWTIGRMTMVDRTLIRLAVYECMVAKSVPVAVALSEAVLLAKEFGSDESPRFVNGVLARVVRAAQ